MPSEQGLLQVALFQSFQYPSGVNCVSLSERGSGMAVAVGSEIEVYCTVTKALLHKTEDAARIKSVAVSADGRRICFGGWSQRCHMLDLQDGVDRSTFDWSHRGLIRRIAVTEDTLYTAVGGDLSASSGGTAKASGGAVV
jgi:tricorn protease-like protein